MFAKLKEKLEQLAEYAKQQSRLNATDGSQFNDPIAKLTEWTALKSGGANFKTHNLVRASDNVILYEISTGGKVFLGLFAVVGVIATLVGLNFLFSSADGGIVLLLLGSIFTAVAYFIYSAMAKTITFDANLGMLWTGKKPPNIAGDVTTAEAKWVYFADIQAIQIIAESVRGNKTTYKSYEINMVLKDGSRFNVVDHGNHSQILIDAENLSAFLAKPIWDAS